MTNNDGTRKPRAHHLRRYIPPKSESTDDYIGELQRQAAERERIGMKARKNYRSNLLQTLADSDYNAAQLDMSELGYSDYMLYVAEDEVEGGYDVKWAKEGMSPHSIEHFDSLDEAVASLPKAAQRADSWEPIRGEDE